MSGLGGCVLLLAAASATLTVDGLTPTASGQTDNLPTVELYVETGIHHSARSAAFSSDGRLLAASCLDRTIKVWDIASGRELVTLPNKNMASSHAFLPSQFVLAAANEDSTFSVWNVDREKLVETLSCSERPSPTIVIDADESVLLCADRAAAVVRRWDLKTHSPLEAIRVRAQLKPATMEVDREM